MSHAIGGGCLIDYRWPIRKRRACRDGSLARPPDLRGLGWAAFGLCLVDGAIFTIPIPHAAPDTVRTGCPSPALLRLPLEPGFSCGNGTRRGIQKPWVSSLAWKLALLATFAAAIGCNSWLNHRADTAATATQDRNRGPGKC